MATSVELHCPIEAAIGGGIALSKEEIEELQSFLQDISDLVPQETEVHDTSTNGESDSDDELAERIGRSNISATLCVPAGGSEHLPGIMTFLKEGIAVFC